MFDGRFKKYRNGLLYDVLADPEETEPLDESSLDATAQQAVAALDAALGSFAGARPARLAK